MYCIFQKSYSIDGFGMILMNEIDIHEWENAASDFLPTPLVV
jgi:hypothetical protein